MGHRAVGVGLIGCGWISKVAHLPNLARTQTAQVVALCDALDAPRAEAMRLFPEAAAYSEARDLIADAAVSAVVIAVPPEHSAALAVAAFEAGKHVYLEKPGALTGAEGRTVGAAWKKAGTVGQIGYNFRNHPAVAEAYRRVSTGEIGTLLAMNAVFTWQTQDGDGWRAKASSGGALVDLASHQIDLARWFFGQDIREVQGRVRAVRHEMDTADVVLGFDAGGTATIHVSSAEGRNANRVSLFGETGHIELDLTQPDGCRLLRGEPARSRTARARDWLGRLSPAALLASGAEPSFAETLEHFLTACQAGSGGQPDVEDAVAVLDVLDRLRASVA